MELLRRIAQACKGKFGYFLVVFGYIVFVVIVVTLVVLLLIMTLSEADTIDEDEFQMIESYELVSANVQTNLQTNGELTGVYLFGTGITSGNVSTEYSPIYQYWYKREDGGIISGVIDYSEFTYPEEIVVIVYEDDEISPKVEIWENGYNPFNRNHRVEYRFTVPTGTFVNNYDFQGISPET